MKRGEIEIFMFKVHGIFPLLYGKRTDDFEYFTVDQPDGSVRRYSIFQVEWYKSIYVGPDH